MTDPGIPDGDGTDAASGVRQAARARARELRALQRRKDSRNRWLLRGGIVGGIVLVLAIVAVVLVTFVQPPGRGPQNMLSDGVTFTTGGEVVRTGGLGPDDEPVPTEATSEDVLAIRVYVDYLSPNAGEFERVNGEQIRTYVQSGAATLEIHPVATLTGRSAGTQYSIRAANAAACVAEFAPSSFLTFHRLLLLDQPEEGKPGFEDAELVDRAEEAGATASQVSTCIESQRFGTWVEEATDRALNGPLPGTEIEALTDIPLVLVGGEPYQYVAESDPDEFARFLLQAGGSSFNQGATPTPTPAPEPAE